MTSAATTIDRDNPWPGLASYDEAAQAFFSGRNAETAELVRRICDEAMTVLFGKSGLGKSSLLKAGVFPVLRQRGLLPVPVRLQFGGDAQDAIEQIAAALFTAFDVEQIEYPPRAVGETLWDYLHRDGLRFWTSKVRPVQPVLVLDQFEEVFTLGRSAPDVADALRERLADLAENRIPAELTARAEAGDAPGAALDVHARPYKIVFSLREDYLPDLEGWVAAMPSLRRNRMRLLPLQREQALQAVCNPHTEHLVDAALARRIVDYLASGAATQGADGATAGDATVEPALLSLVCRGINEARKREGKARFDDALFEAGKGRIVADFYRESLADQPEALRAFIEDELVTDQGFRNSYSVVQAIASGKATREQIMVQVERRLLRIEQHLGAERVELTHDLLTVPVLAGRKVRVEARWAQQASRARRKSVLALVGMVGILVVLAGLLVNARIAGKHAEIARDDANHARDDALEAQRQLAKQYETLAIQKRDIETKEREANESAKLARAAESRASEASARASVQADRAQAEATRADRASRLARSREIAARAKAEMERDRELAVLLGVEALRIADTPEAREALLDAARYVWPTTVLTQDQIGGTPVLTGLDASGRQLVVIAERDQATLSLWDLGKRAPEKARWQRIFDPASVGFATFIQDGTQLLLGRRGRVERLDVRTGSEAEPALALPPRLKEELPTQLAVSGNGHWLAAVMPSGAVLMRDLNDSTGTWETAAERDALGIAISDDGQRITIVAGDPLRAAFVERDGIRGWGEPRQVDVTSCAKPQSVSPGASYAMATWGALACSKSLDTSTSADSLPSGLHETTIADTVASAFGAAFVAVLSNRDLQVGSGDPAHPDSTSEVKGLPMAARLASRDNLTSNVSVNANGTRIAWLSSGEVRVVSLAGYKLILAEYPNGMIDSEDGRRIVQARAVSSGAFLWMTPIAAVSEGRELPRPGWYLKLPRLPTSLTVNGDSVFVTMRAEAKGKLATTVYDLSPPKGNHDLGPPGVRAGPFVGAGRAVGRDGRLILVQPEGNGQGEAQLVRLADGRVLQRWQVGGSQSVRLSSAGTALLVLRPADTTPRTLIAEAYVLRGEQLVPAGRVVDLPPAAARRIDINDAATAVTEPRWIRVRAVDGGEATTSREMLLRWPLRAGGETSARDPAGAVRQPLQQNVTSPSGRFVWRQSVPDGARLTVLTRREGGAALLNFGTRNVSMPHFSDDERWLAFVEEDSLQVLDLQRLELVLTWHDLQVRSTRFTHDGSLLRLELEDGAALLVPMDRALLDGFARWLVTRELTRDERCRHGLDTKSCMAVSARNPERKPDEARPQ